ncbi:MAG: Vitamin K epoxide reductase, partial [uncultured Sphingomonadaceae bacterium]
APREAAARRTQPRAPLGGKRRPAAPSARRRPVPARGRDRWRGDRLPDRLDQAPARHPARQVLERGEGGRLRLRLQAAEYAGRALDDPDLRRDRRARRRGRARPRERRPRAADRNGSQGGVRLPDLPQAGAGGVGGERGTVQLVPVGDRYLRHDARDQPAGGSEGGWARPGGSL